MKKIFTAISALALCGALAATLAARPIKKSSKNQAAFNDINMVEFKAVRIPFFNEDGEPIEAEDWAKGVRKAFKAETGIKVSKGQGNTLGRVNFLVGQD